MLYRSRWSLAGLPLVHIATASAEDGRPKRGIARGWIAIGDISFGVILSIGGIATGGIAVGGLGLGVLSIAGLALGGFAVGGGALGFAACGGVAVAWRAALGGLAVAREYAAGGLAIAAHTSDALAEAFFAGSAFFSAADFCLSFSPLLLLAFAPGLHGLLARVRRRREATG